MARPITYHMVQTNIETNYKCEKRKRDGRPLSTGEFINLVKGVFKYFNLEIEKDPQAEKWYRASMISFGSRGGSKKPRAPKKK